MQKVERNSTIEILRILTMMAIIAHHFVVNSTVIELMTNDPSPRFAFLLVWGMWGKTGINIFVLISGWFLCTGNLTIKRYMKLLLEVLFYSIVIYLIFCFTGYLNLGPKTFLRILMSPITGIGDSFVASFLFFYAFVPFYNKLISHLNERQHRYLVLGLICFMTLSETLLNTHLFNLHVHVMYEPLWYVALYFIAAYLHLYPNKYTSSLKYTSLSSVFSILLSVMSVLLIYYFERTTDVGHIYFFVNDSNKLLALWVAVSVFLLFVNLPSFQNKLINTISAGTFAVLLIHANSDTMRYWLWQKIIDVPNLYANGGG